jgi:hypothetical protein
MTPNYCLYRAETSKKCNVFAFDCTFRKLSLMRSWREAARNEYCCFNLRRCLLLHFPKSDHIWSQVARVDVIGSQSRGGELIMDNALSKGYIKPAALGRGRLISLISVLITLS